MLSGASQLSSAVTVEGSLCEICPYRCSSAFIPATGTTDFSVCAFPSCLQRPRPADPTVRPRHRGGGGAAGERPRSPLLALGPGAELDWIQEEKSLSSKGWDLAFWVFENWTFLKMKSCGVLRWPKSFISGPGESREEPGALMKRVRHPANTLTGPRWLLGNKAKWLLSDLVCLGAAVPAPVALSAVPLR